MNKGNFRELLTFLGDHNEQLDKVILENASQNLKLTSPDTQKDIVNAIAEETTEKIMAKLGDEFFAVLVDESRDVSFKEQMTVVIRFVNKRGFVIERFLGIVHVSDIAALSLKAVHENLFGKHGLSLSRLRCQGYDGVSNMRGEFNGLKTLIVRENETAYFVRCFAHQLQLCLVVVAKSHSKVALLFQMVSIVLNVTCASCKRRDRLRKKWSIEIVEAISNYEILTGRGLNQETVFAHAADTQGSSHFKALNSIIALFSATIDVIEEVAEDGLLPEQRGEAAGLVDTMQSFEFVFSCHLIRNALSITYDLSQTLQRKDQDMVNAIRLVHIAKSQMQEMSTEWSSLFQEVCTFCEKHGIEISNMEDMHVRRPRHRARDITNLHYYRVEMFYTVIDMQLQELNSRFTKTTTKLLICIACLDPNNSFSSFNKEKLLQMAQFYPSDFNR